MTWGMHLPSGPYGNYEGPVDHYGDGWSHRLREHYAQLTPEAQKALYDPGEDGSSYVYYVSGKFNSEIGSRENTHQPVFTPILDHEPPRSFVIDTRIKNMASIISLPNRVWAVDDAAKEVIERLEPSVHQFFPIQVGIPRSPTYRYFIFVCAQYFDCLVPEACQDGALRPTGPGSYLPSNLKAGISGLAFSKADFGNAHLWRDRALREWHICFSDELQAELKKACPRLPKHYRTIDV